MSGQDADRLQRILTAEEQQYAAQAKTPPAQRQRVLARAFVRCILAKYLINTPPERVSNSMTCAAWAASLCCQAVNQLPDRCIGGVGETDAVDCLSLSAALLCCVLLLQLTFGKGPHGKPFLQHASADAADQVLAAKLEFNLSHTQSILGLLAACARVPRQPLRLLGAWFACSCPTLHSRV